MSPLSVCVCVGKNNIKEGSPHGSRAPSGRLCVFVCVRAHVCVLVWVCTCARARFS